MKITKENNEMVVRLPLTQKESNCYMADDELQDVQNLVGVINGEYDYTISQSINMSYAGKPDQLGEPYLHISDKEEFEQICKLFNLNVWNNSQK
jgi:metal-sulfur cluster biosynthetic enzyme